jgi:hypothetical protein
VKSGDLLVEVLGQHVDADGVLLELGEELDLPELLGGLLEGRGSRKVEQYRY